VDSFRRPPAAEVRHGRLLTICAALQFQNAELDADIALIVARCVGDKIDRQI